MKSKLMADNSSSKYKRIGTFSQLFCLVPLDFTLISNHSWIRNLDSQPY